ncbi:hypothetical protein BD769DRAFT_1387902 [Suillus cothurnatus]|nr:hypothetical protein BD769DRAFT_1387902 [Suillus cothurnatus]
MFEKFSIPIWVCFPRNASGIDASPINSSLRHYIPSQGAITHTTKLIQWGQPDNKSQSALGWDNSRLGWGQAGGEQLVSDIPEAHMDSLFPISQPHSGQKQEEDWNAFFAQCREKNKKKDHPVLASAATEDHSVLASIATEDHPVPEDRPEEHHPVLASTTTEDCPVLASTGINNSMAITAGQTQSECLFSISTDIDSCSLTFQNSDKFYLHWVLATEEYLHALGDIELKLMRKITKNNYISNSMQKQKNQAERLKRHRHTPAVRLNIQGETNLLETKAFLKLFISCTKVHESDNMVLFQLFKGFITDPTTPCDWIVSHDGASRKSQSNC